MGIESNAYIFGWNRPVTGREAMAGELFNTTVAYFEKCKKSGKIESWEPVFLQAHGGDLNGFFFLKGTHQNLNWLSNDDEFQDIVLRAGMCLSNFGFTPAWRGGTVNELMGRWMKAIPR